MAVVLIETVFKLCCKPIYFESPRKLCPTLCKHYTACNNFSSGWYNHVRPHSYKHVLQYQKQEVYSKFINMGDNFVRLIHQ